ncbi:PEP-CTERM putative exosortase interaction domain-containing protein [Burkholderiales bacterium JOSHI_001]|nr:PEP-CTERM putative exosortase interaction domain-containing protein [Burkholderiales bacterium JOSHI_001]
MNPTFTARLAALALGAATMAGAQAAALIDTTSNPLAASGQVIDFNNFDGLSTTGPLLVGSAIGVNVDFTSSPFTTVGASAQDLGDNGLWGARGTPADGLVDTPTGDGNFLASAFVARRGEFGFTFSAPVAKVGAFFNQFQAAGATGNSLRVLAYDQDGNDIESFSYSVNTDAFGYNEGTFLGFARATADIWGFGVTDGTFVMDNLTLAPVPEPGSYGLLMAGLLALGLRSRARNAR